MSLHKQEYPMEYVGIYLRKKTISVYAVDKAGKLGEIFQKARPN